jgi:exosortase
MSYSSNATLDQPVEGNAWRRLGQSATLELLLLLAAYGAVVVAHFIILWQSQEYQYFPFVVAAIGWLGYHRVQQSSRRHAGSESYSYPMSCAVLATAMLIVSVIVDAPWVGLASLNIFLAGVVYQVTRAHSAPGIWGVWALSWLLVPLPFGLDRRLMLSLQTASSWLSSQVLDLVRINHLMAGNVVQLPSREFFVDEACSGIVSVMSVIAAGAVYVVWQRRTLIHSVILLCAGIGWAVCLNVARISLIAITHHRYGIDLSTGWQHDALGLGLFGLTFVAVVSTDQLLLFLLEPITGESGGHGRNRLLAAWNWIVTPKGQLDEVSHGAEAPHLDLPTVSLPRRPWLMLMACFGLIQLGLFGIGLSVADPSVNRLLTIQGDFLPTQIGVWEKSDFSEQHREDKELFGEFSKVFRFKNRRTGQLASVSFDFPFPSRQGWKELTVCYTSTGWTLNNRNVNAPPATSKDNGWNYVEANLVNQMNENGYLKFSHVDGIGNVVSPPTGGIAEKVWRRLRRTTTYLTSPHLFQTQVWVVAEAPPDEQTKQEIQQLFSLSRLRLRDFLGSAQN